MPNVKQPTPLQEMAFDRLIAHVVHHFDKLSIANLSNRIRPDISLIRKHVYDHIPRSLFAEFCKRFLNEFYDLGTQRPERRSNTHNRASLEIMMDLEIPGLICEGYILCHLDSRDAHRLKSLKTLDLSNLWHAIPGGLANFCFQDLTTLSYPRLCTYRDLVIIGLNCPKLQALIIPHSKYVTDKGLRAIRPCSELRIIDLCFCSVTDKGINELLSVHKKLEEFNVGRYYFLGEISFDVLSRQMTLVCPSIKRFAIKSPVTDERLDSVVALFPNLSHLRICCKLTGDLCRIGKLGKLKELNFSNGDHCVSVVKLKQLLTVIGENISVLNLNTCYPRASLTHDDLDFISKVCGNIQCLGFDYEATGALDRLIIPSFRELISLKCVGLTIYTTRVTLEFDNLPKLETLTIHGFRDMLKLTESLMSDNINLPNLKEVLTYYREDEQVERIRSIAKSKNLDFSLRFSK